MYSTLAFSQSDSVDIILNSELNDTTKFKLVEHFIEKEEEHLNLKLKWFKQLETFCNLKHNKILLAKTYFLTGNTYFDFSKYDEAITYLYKALPIAEDLKLEWLQSKIFNYLGIIYSDRGDSKKAIYFFRKTYTIALKLKDVNQQFVSANNVAVDYNNIKQPALALNYLSICEGILKKTKAYKFKKNRYYYLVSVSGNKQESYTLLNDIKRLKIELDSMRGYYNKSPKENNVEISFNHFIGQYYIFIKNYNEAIKFYKKNVRLIPLNDFQEQKKTYSGLSNCYLNLKDYKNAFESQKYVFAYNDSIANTEQLQKANEIENNYKELKFEKELEIQKLNNANKSLQLNRNKIILISLSGIVIILILSLFFVFRLLKLRRNDLSLLKNKNEIIEEKQKEILSSIRYAKRIQDSFLASEKYIQKKLQNLKGK